MQAYRAAFAKIYNLQWGGFARQVAPLIKEYYESTAIGEENKDLLDFDVLAQGGIFVFDLNTPTGLQRWNSVSIEDNPDLMLVRKGFYNKQSQRAVMTISGFIRSDGGMYERFEETVFNTVFSLREVEEALLKTGFQKAHAARVQELSEPLAAPENEGRVFFVAKKP